MVGIGTIAWVTPQGHGVPGGVEHGQLPKVRLDAGYGFEHRNRSSVFLGGFGKLIRTDGTGHERGDGRDRSPGGVGQVQGHSFAISEITHTHPYCGGSNCVHADLGPGERQAYGFSDIVFEFTGDILDGEQVLGTVHESRMCQKPSVSSVFIGQDDLGIQSHSARHAARML